MYSLKSLVAILDAAHVQDILKVDPTQVNQVIDKDGSSLLHSVVLSCVPEDKEVLEKAEKTLIVLFAYGIDPTRKTTSYKLTATELAKHMKCPESLVALLTAYEERWEVPQRGTAHPLGLRRRRPVFLPERDKRQNQGNDILFKTTFYAS